MTTDYILSQSRVSPSFINQILPFEDIDTLLQGKKLGFVGTICLKLDVFW